MGGKLLSVADINVQHVYRWQQMLDKCSEEFKTAVQLMIEIQNKVEKHENRVTLLENIFSAPQMVTYFRGCFV
jgi:hypothetical protein